MIDWTQITRFFKGDRVIWIVLLFLSLISLLIVYSATGSLAYRQAEGQTWRYLFKQIGFLMVGFVIIYLQIRFIPVNVYSKISFVLVALSLVLIVLSLLVGISNEETGRTLRLGVFSFQPAELAKIGLVCFAARMLSIKQKNEETRKQAFYIILIVSILVCGAIFFVNFSTAALLFLAIVVMMFVGKVQLKFLLIPFVGAIALLFLVYVTAPLLPKIGRIQTVRARIERYIHKDSNQQTNEGLSQSDYGKLAIYEGGTIGKGPGGSQVRNYMAAAYNDFIYAIFIEEYGLVGSLVLMLLYLIFLYRGGIIVKRCTRTFPAFLVVGLTGLIVLQAMTNMGVAVGVLPDTGQPLPWVSMGGTSTLFTAASFGCILSVSYQTQKDKKTSEPVALPMEGIVDEDQPL